MRAGGIHIWRLFLAGEPYHWRVSGRRRSARGHRLSRSGTGRHQDQAAEGTSQAERDGLYYGHCDAETSRGHALGASKKTRRRHFQDNDVKFTGVNFHQRTRSASAVV